MAEQRLQPSTLCPSVVPEAINEPCITSRTHVWPLLPPQRCISALQILQAHEAHAPLQALESSTPSVSSMVETRLLALPTDAGIREYVEIPKPEEPPKALLLTPAWKCIAGVAGLPAQATTSICKVKVNAHAVERLSHTCPPLIMERCAERDPSLEDGSKRLEPGSERWIQISQWAALPDLAPIAIGLIVSSRATCCGILPQSRLASPGVFTLFTHLQQVNIDGTLAMISPRCDLTATPMHVSQAAAAGLLPQAEAERGHAAPAPRQVHQGHRPSLQAV